MNYLITSNKKKIRIYLLLSLTILTLFIPFIHLKGYKLEWNIFFLIFIFIDFSFFILEKKSIKIDNISIIILLFYIYNLLLFLINLYEMEKGLLIGFMHFSRASILLFYYIWMLNTFDQTMLNKLISIIVKTLYILAIVINIDYLFFQNFISFYGKDSLEFINFGKNTLGYISVLSLLFVEKNITGKIKKILIIILFTHIIILTNSDSAVLGLLVIIIYRLFILNKPKKFKKQIIYKLTFLISSFILLIYFADNIFKSEIFNNLYVFFKTTLNQGISNSSEFARFNVQTYFLRNPNWNPIFGNYYYDFFSKFSYTMHNQFTQMLNDIGIIGLSLFISLVYLIFTKISSKYYEFFIIMIIYSLIENFFFQFFPLLLLFVLLNVKFNTPEHVKETYDI